MDRTAARLLVQETFERPFGRSQFERFITELLNTLNTAKRFEYQGQYIPDAFRDFVQKYERIGQYVDPKQRKLDVLVVHLKRETSRDRARTAQRSFVARYLRERDAKEAALVAFVSSDPSDWRFSFVRMRYDLRETRTGRVTAREVLTPATRSSFLVGTHERSHTAQGRLEPLLVSEDANPTLEDIEHAFSVEPVTREFYEQYRSLYRNIADALDGVIQSEPTVRADFAAKGILVKDFAKKLLGQIVFLYFLQKKGWFGVPRDGKWGAGSKQFMRDLAERKVVSYDNFFNDILESLFYEALANERQQDYFSRFNCKIPFLNGGLFEPLNDYDWVGTNILLPNELFTNSGGTGIFDVFDRYNFTVREDEPLEREVAIDPEMLGKVFENLLGEEEADDRRRTGTYYTPRNIVHFMCRESIAEYLSERLAGTVSHEDIATLLAYGDDVVEHDARVERAGKETEAYSYRMPDAVRTHAAALDAALAGVRVCDPAIGSGAFPVGVMHEVVRARQVLSTYCNGGVVRSAYDLKRHTIQESLYGVDIEASAVEIAKLRLWLSLIVDEEDYERIQPLPNLDYKIVRGNSLIGYPYIPGWTAELEPIKERFFSTTSAKRKRELREQINAKYTACFKQSKESLGYEVDFDFRINFSEVFHDGEGFDVVIANPPYVKEYVNRRAFINLKSSPYYQGKMDIWYMFACLGIDLLSSGGILTLIAQNNWVTSHGASKMRNKVLRDTQVLKLIDFGAHRIFEAGIQTMVMMFRKDVGQDSYTFDFRRLLGSKTSDKDVVALLGRGSTASTEYLAPRIARGELVDRFLTFNTSDTERVLEKIYGSSNFRLDPTSEVAQGIVCPQDRLNKKSRDALGGKFAIGQGVFVLSTDELNALRLSANERQRVKPLYTTQELNGWEIEPQNRWWIIYTDAQFKDARMMQKYPKLKKHLDQFRAIITSDNLPYGLHRARDEYFFKGEKILAVRKCNRPTFTYVDFDSYALATFNVIKTGRVNLKYLVGVLNSKLIAFWLRYRGKMQGTNYQVDKEPLVNLPLVETQIKTQEVISRVVDTIFSAKKRGSDTTALEREVDQLVYKVYGLTPEDISLIEDSGSV